MVEVELDAVYTFCVEEATRDNSQLPKLIIEWLQSNLSNIKDANEETIFSKVNLGYNENTLKGFGKKPVCDVYLTNINYESDFDSNRPSTINSAVICYLKGNMNTAYLKACELTDYLIQEFEENNNWRQYLIDYTDPNGNTYKRKIVSQTLVKRTELRVIPGQKTYGVLCAFELEHTI